MSGTTGTPRTQSFLLTTEFQDSQPAGSISPGDMRDLITSMPMPNIIHAPFRPNFPSYNAKFDGSTNDTAAFTAMFADITSQGFGEVILPSGRTVLTQDTLFVPSNCTIRGAGQTSTILQRSGSGSGAVLNVSGTGPDGSAALHCVNVTLADFQIDGNNGTGPNLRLFYSSNHNLERLFFNNNQGPGLQAVEWWDSDILSCLWQDVAGNTSATAYTTGPEGGGTTIGSEAIQIMGNTVSGSSGFGHGDSQSSNNQLKFLSCRIESFNAGAVVVLRGPGTNNTGSNNYRIIFRDLKLECSSFTGKYVFQFDQYSEFCMLDSVYLSCSGSTGANVGTMRFIYLGGYENSIRKIDWSLGEGSVWDSAVLADSTALKLGCKVSEINCDGFAPVTSLVHLTGGANALKYSDLYYVNGETTPVVVTADAFSALIGAATPGTALTNVCDNIVTSVAGGTFFQLPANTGPRVDPVTVVNATASTISIKPPAGGNIAGGTTDAAVTIAARGLRTFRPISILSFY